MNQPTLFLHAMCLTACSGDGDTTTATDGDNVADTDTDTDTDMIQRILEEPAIEAVLANPDDRVDHQADTVNEF